MHLPDFAEVTVATLAQPCLKQVQEVETQTAHLGPIASEAVTVARPSETKHVDAEHSAVAATPSESAVEAPAEHSAVAATPSEGAVEPPASISAPAEAYAKATTTRAPQRCRTCGLVSKDWR